jgi:hypothetical protein
VGVIAQHRVEDVAASAGQTDEGGVALLPLGPLPVVVGTAGRVGQRGERGQEERAFELAVAGPSGVLALDAGAGAGRRAAGVVVGWRGVTSPVGAVVGVVGD